MSLRFPRQKDRHFLLSILYKLDKLMPFSKEAKLRFYLDMEWIFDRLAHEKSFRVFSEHPVRVASFRFLQSHLSTSLRVLDLGCGSGDLSYQVAAHAKSVVALDHNPQQIEWARKHNIASNLTFVNAEASAFLTTHPEPFDVLVLSHILEHLDQPETFLNQYKPHFRFTFIEAPDSERTPLNVYRQKLDVKLQYSDNDHIWEFDRNDMVQIIERCGLSIVDREYRFGVQKYWCENRLP